MSTSRLLLVVGLQKSGTTLLGRLLERLEMVAKPLRSEGDAFWGNEPPFAPFLLFLSSISFLLSSLFSFFQTLKQNC